MQAVKAGGVLLAEPGEIMKKLFLALMAVAAALAITPVAQADSFSLSISGSNFTTHLTLQANPDGLVPGPGSSTVSAFTVTSVSGTFTDPIATYTFGSSAVVPATAGANAYNLTDADGYLFDDLIYPTLPNNEILDWGGILIQPNGYPGFYLNIFGGYFGSTDGLTAPDNGYSYFADNNYYSNNQIPGKGSGEGAEIDPPAPADLVETPEPGSLLLLGTGLLGLAFAVFRKASKPSSREALNT